MSILKVEDDAEEMYEVSSVRIGALKLLTSIVTIDQFGSIGAHLLSPGDLSQLYSTLRCAKNIDKNREVRQLACDLFKALNQVH